MQNKNKIALIYGGAIVLGSAFAYWIYTMNKNKATVVDNAIVDDNEVINTTPTPAPKVNPFTVLLGKEFVPIKFKPTDYSVKNPFADVNTAIANVNPFSSSVNTGERLA
jgi:hypothetical protein